MKKQNTLVNAVVLCALICSSTHYLPIHPAYPCDSRFRFYSIV